VQLRIPQVVPLQVGWPLATEQMLPQDPQLLTLLVSAVSQPSDALALQFPKPAAQMMPHWLFVQVACPLVELQATPQPPQLPTLPDRSVSQPLPVFESQLPNGDWHEAISQLPVAQVALALGNTHSCPHWAQLSSVLRLASHPS
jgi:hypothetical protein